MPNDLHQISKSSFRSHGKSLLYSGAFSAILSLQFSNWTEAAKRADIKKRIPIERTSGGRFLDKPDRNSTYNREIAFSLWQVASQKYVRQIKGDVQTLVCCSNFYSTFRSIELPELLVNTNVRNINGKPRTYYLHFKDNLHARLLRSGGMNDEEATQKAMDATYRLIAREEIKSDRKLARRTKDTELEKFADKREEAMKLFAAEEIKKRQDPAFLNALRARDEQMEDMLRDNPELKNALTAVFSSLPKTPADPSAKAAFKKTTRPVKSPRIAKTKPPKPKGL